MHSIQYHDHQHPRYYLMCQLSPVLNNFWSRRTHLIHIHQLDLYVILAIIVAGLDYWLIVAFGPRRYQF